SLFEDSQGLIWIATPQGIAYLENERFVRVRRVPSGMIVEGMVEDAVGSLWLADVHLGLFRIGRANDVRKIPWEQLGHKDDVIAIAVDRSRNALWLGFVQGDVASFADGRIRATYTSAEGLGKGAVNDLHLDRGGTLWAATEGGLSRLKDGGVATLT